MELHLNEVQPESNSNTYTISSINLKNPKLNCETENLYLNLTLDPSNLPNNDVYEVIHVNTTANPLDVNTSAGPFDVNTTANNLDVNMNADTLPVNNEYAESEPSWWRKKTSKWLIGAVTVAACVIMWIASSEINWTRKDEDISKLTTNNNVHPPSKINWTRNDNNISKTHRKGKNHLQGKISKCIISLTALLTIYIHHPVIHFVNFYLNRNIKFIFSTLQ